MSEYNLVLSTDKYTIVAEYTPEKHRSDQYQSEYDLEKEFIRMLQEQGYDYLSIADEKSLILNLRNQLEILNNYRFTNDEWDRFFKTSIAPVGEGIVEKSRRIQIDHIQNLRRDDNSTKNIILIDKKNIHNNKLQVINQYVPEGGKHDNRYDVTVLVNGLPLVHIELKRRGVDIREAFNQINRYQDESFWAGCGLYEYIQIFVISNGTYTKYYSNTIRDGHLKEQTATKNKSRKTSNSFEFTSYWTDGKNRVISDLIDFTKTFFSKHTILSILVHYCIFTSENLLLVMRPYQIAATERILNRINISSNYKKMGTSDAGGYIWHTTGSGKTLTSFKTAQLVSKLPYIDKVLFVVDRKDLDYQTMKEYDKFEKGAANGSKDTKILSEHLVDPNMKILVTTIQKLGVFIKRNKTHEIYGKHVVLIFDECHRSQFGDMHKSIVKHFKNYHIFGFTGTPIFAVNAVNGKDPALRTTEDVFGDRLHVYTVVNAINDGNVLPFHIDYISTIKMNEYIEEEEVEGIDTSGIMNSLDRISLVTEYILNHYDQKTRAGNTYKFKGRTVRGFNSIFAVDSIPMLKLYYKEIKKQMRVTGKNLKIATIFSYAPNGEDQDDPIYEGELTLENIDLNDRDFLDSAIEDYNKIFSTNYSTNSSSFDNYYKDLSQRMKNREIDLLIVVDMFLTGFDATTLNTLWVDKFLKNHRLIQAFSRTNRILNSVKTYGNIICFRNLRKHVDEAIALFGDTEACGTVLLRTYDEYYNGYDDNDKHVPGYVDRLKALFDKFPLDEEILGEQNKREFLKLFGVILRLRNILQAFDEFEGDTTISEREFQDYQGRYIEIYRQFRHPGDKVPIILDVAFEVDLVRQDEINIDYIIEMIKTYHEKNTRGKEILVDLERAIASSITLHSKKELIMKFIRAMDPEAELDFEEEWRTYVNKQKYEDLERIITYFGLKPETRRLMEIAFRDGVFKTTGTDIDKIMPPMSRFGSSRSQKKDRIIKELSNYYDQYSEL